MGWLPWWGEPTGREEFRGVPRKVHLSDGTTFELEPGQRFKAVRHENGDVEYLVGTPKQLRDYEKSLREQDS